MYLRVTEIGVGHALRHNGQWWAVTANTPTETGRRLELLRGTEHDAVEASEHAHIAAIAPEVTVFTEWVTMLNGKHLSWTSEESATASGTGPVLMRVTTTSGTQWLVA